MTSTPTKIGILWENTALVDAYTRECAEYTGGATELVKVADDRTEATLGRITSQDAAAIRAWIDHRAALALGSASFGRFRLRLWAGRRSVWARTLCGGPTLAAAVRGEHDPCPWCALAGTEIEASQSERLKAEESVRALRAKLAEAEKRAAEAEAGLRASQAESAARAGRVAQLKAELRRHGLAVPARRKVGGVGSVG